MGWGSPRQRGLGLTSNMYNSSRSSPSASGLPSLGTEITFSTVPTSARMRKVGDSMCPLAARARGLLASEASTHSPAGEVKNVGGSNQSSIQKEMGDTAPGNIWRWA